MKKFLAQLLAVTLIISMIVLPVSASPKGNTYNGTAIPFSDWTNAGNGAWQETDGVLSPSDAQTWTMLRYNKELGSYYTVELDVKQPDQNDSIKIGFEVEDGDNFTESGLILEMHNAGVSRIFNQAINSTNESAYGGCNNGYGGSQGFSKSTDWIHVKLQRAGSDFAVTLGDGETRTFQFSSDAYNGGHLVLGALNGRAISYQNITITKSAAPVGTVENTFNGTTIPFADWNSVGEGSWQEMGGVVAPSDAQSWTMLQFKEALGSNYTIDLDVKQPDQNNSFKLGFEVEAGQNFTQSGLILDLHNAGVSRIFNWNINSADEGAYGGCNNGYGGTKGFSKSTDWIHVKIQRADNDFTVKVNDGETRTFQFTTDAYNGGHLVLGSVENRAISYRNIVITTSSSSGGNNQNTFNGVGIPFGDWRNAGNGSWQYSYTTIEPSERDEWTMLDYNRALGEYYSIELDVKQPDTNDGIKIGFEVKPGENFTQSGLVFEMHNAGVARVYDWGINMADEGAYGGCNNGYGGTRGFSGTTDWIHVKIQRCEDRYVVTYNDGSVKTFGFTLAGHSGGHLMLGAVNYRQIAYQNIHINTYSGPFAGFDYIETNGNDTASRSSGASRPGRLLRYRADRNAPELDSRWLNVGNGWWRVQDGILHPGLQDEWTMIASEKRLGDAYTVEFDVKQPNTDDGIKIGFEAEYNHNFTQSGLVLEMHNYGVMRIFDWAINARSESAYGGCNNGFGGNQTFSKTTDWIHVKIQRNGSRFNVTVNDGTEHTFAFTSNSYNGGHIVLGSVNHRDVQYKNIILTKQQTSPLPASRVNTLNGQLLTPADWRNAGNGSWYDDFGVIKPAESKEWTMLALDKALGKDYVAEFDVKQPNTDDGIKIGFEVANDQNFTESGLILELHNLGVARVYDWKINLQNEWAYGGCNNSYGGRTNFSRTTDWIHVRIARSGDTFTVSFNDGAEKTFTFNSGNYNGGHLMLGSVNGRVVEYRDFRVTTADSAV